MNLKQFLEDDQIPALEFSGISEVSYELEDGDLFLAVGNSAQIVEHIQEAERLGAVAAVVDRLQSSDIPRTRLPVFQIDGLSNKRRLLASLFFREPSNDVEVVGITGTNGKTSVAYWIADISTRLGIKTGYCGTLGWGALENLKPSKLTTPNPTDIQRILSWFVKEQFSRVALEVSSHALHQGRTEAVKFATGVFTNLSRDHLDYHKTMKAYARSKAKLFEEYELSRAIICVDDSMGRELAKTTVADVLTYGAKGDISWSVGNNFCGQEVIWNTPWGALKSAAPFFCEFSIANLAAVIGVLLTAGFSIEQLGLVMPEMGQVPGRLETLNPDSDKGPKVIVDFAHTPSAVEAVLQSVSGMTQGKIISVLGCGGDRDQGKRSQMGEIVTRLSDLVWLTSDNPRSEAPEEIINQMTSEVEATNFFVSIDRENAIRGAIHGAKKEDIVVLFGKGDESTQEINGVFLPFKDKDVAEKILRGLG